MRTSGKWYDGVAPLEMLMKEPIHQLVLLVFLVLVAAAAFDVSAQKSAAQAPSEAADLGFRVVVNASNPTTELSAKNISKMFYKRIPRWEDWGDGKTEVEPIDRETVATVRNLFSKKIHNKSASYVEKYWQKMIFSGRDIPPRRENSDARVLSVVRSEPGAIGYVTSEATLGEGVKELRISN